MRRAWSGSPSYSVGEDYLVAGRIHLGTLLDLVATFLDTLDLLFDLYQDEPVAEGAQAAARQRCRRRLRRR